jgi:hypothetical protein
MSNMVNNNDMTERCRHVNNNGMDEQNVGNINEQWQRKKTVTSEEVAPARKEDGEARAEIPTMIRRSSETNLVDSD